MLNAGYEPLFHTYSIVARDAESGELGVAVQTHQMCVGGIVPWLLPGVGAVATQASANIRFGPTGLSMLREGIPAPQVVDALVASDPAADVRQLAVLDAAGRVAAWTGAHCIPHANHHTGVGYSVQANMMARDTVVPAMAEAYEAATGDLSQRMMAALRAAQREEGDIRGMQSAALRIVGGAVQAADSVRPHYDLRVDEASDPLAELGRLVRLRRAQILNAAGYPLLAEDRERALATWAEARAMAPELEELGFWQAVHLADVGADAATGAAILDDALAHESRRSGWIELLYRLEACGRIERRGAAAELVAALAALDGNRTERTDR
ncbi:MAG: DUF1028 domain-containing protein [Anaerolineae bacterium]|nr:DUF1028 domain-containing protein [Anaerolineae bacterium]